MQHITLATLNHQAFVVRVRSLATLREEPTAPHKAIAFLVGRPTGMVMPFQLAAHRMFALPLFPFDVTCHFGDPSGGRQLLEQIRSWQIHCVVIDGVDPGKVEIAVKDLELPVVDTSVAAALIENGLSALHTCRALLYLALDTRHR